MYGGKIAPATGAYKFATVANFAHHILRIKTIFQNPKKNSLPYKYFSIQNIIIEDLFEWKSNQLNS